MLKINTTAKIPSRGPGATAAPMDRRFRMFHVAKLYYVDHLKQAAIAQRLDVSPMLVSRILRRAERAGIVTVHVKTPVQLDLDLAVRLCARYPKLNECLVLAVEPGDDVRAKVGELAAQYLEDLLQPKSVLGLSWGKTIYETVRLLPILNLRGLRVVQLSGGFLSLSGYLAMPSNIVRLASERLGGSPFFVNAPMFAGSVKARRELLNDAGNRQVMALAARSHINLFGVSRLGRGSTLARVNVLSAEDIRELRAKGAIGDVAGFFIDRRGEPVSWSKSGRYVGASLKAISNARHVVCAAGEKEKAEVCRVAMERGYFNVLITTAPLARALVS